MVQLWYNYDTTMVQLWYNYGTTMGTLVKYSPRRARLMSVPAAASLTGVVETRRFYLEFCNVPLSNGGKRSATEQKKQNTGSGRGARAHSIHSNQMSPRNLDRPVPAVSDLAKHSSSQRGVA